MESRFNVAYERYIKQVLLEGETLAEVVTTSVVPAAERQLATSAAAGAAMGGSSKAMAARVRGLGEALEAGLDRVAKLHSLADELAGVHDEPKLARRLADEMRPLAADLREAADRLEMLVDDEHWPLPKYREMLFAK
jgi:glutamine synthetase